MLKPYYETGYDLHVANYIAYGHSDNKLYEDAAHTTVVKKADAEKAFKLGRLMIDDGTNVLQAVAMTATGFITYDAALRQPGRQRLRTEFSALLVSCN